MSTMLIPGLNQLAEPEIVKVDTFESIFSEFKDDLVEYVTARNPANGAKLAVSLENDAELLTMFLQAMTLRVQGLQRQYNGKIKQMLAWWAEGSNLDVRLADVGLERRVITPADDTAYPPIPAVQEEDDEARLRYYLAPHAPAAGSRLQYRREAMTLGERATVQVEAPEAGKLVVTYTFAEDGYAAQVKDANGRRTGPGAVTVTILGREGDGTPSAGLLAAVRAHYARDDVRPETDEVTVKAATIRPYQIKATVYIRSGPDAQLTKDAAEEALQKYADSRHRLEGYIDPDRIKHELMTVGAERLVLESPLTALDCAASEAPYCSGIELEVLTL